MQNFENTSILGLTYKKTCITRKCLQWIPCFEDFLIVVQMGHQEDLSDVCPANALLLSGWRMYTYKPCIPEFVYACLFDPKI